MLGTIVMHPLGRYVVSGESPEELLWDLYDQQIGVDQRAISLGGATVYVDANPDYAQDGGERLANRGSDAWRREHVRYFVSLLTDGALELDLPIDQEALFLLHTARLYSSVLEAAIPWSFSQAQIRVALYKYGSDTPEYHKALDEVRYSDYPYDGLTPANLLNYMQAKGILEFQELGTGREHGILTKEEAALLGTEIGVFYQEVLAEEKRLLAGQSTRRSPRKKHKT